MDKYINFWNSFTMGFKMFLIIIIIGLTYLILSNIFEFDVKNVNGNRSVPINITNYPFTNYPMN